MKPDKERLNQAFEMPGAAIAVLLVLGAELFLAALGLWWDVLLVLTISAAFFGAAYYSEVRRAAKEK